MRMKLGTLLLTSLIIVVGLLLIPGAMNLSQAEDNENQRFKDNRSSVSVEENETEEALTVEMNRSTGDDPLRLQKELIQEHRERKAREKGKPESLGSEGRQEEVKGSGKAAYLTFDDGPSRHMTPRILQVLDRYGIKATFFVLGKMVDKNPDVLRTAYEKGHSIGNHTYSHDYGIIYKDTDRFLEEVQRTETAVQEATGDYSYRTSLVRLPGGSHAGYKKPTVRALEEAGYRVFDWNALNGDSEVEEPTRDYLIARFKETYKKRDQVVILMHDTDDKATTLEALPSIIEHLILEGYSFETLEDYKH